MQPITSFTSRDNAKYGAGTMNRTRDLLITSQLLYQLSYAGALHIATINRYRARRPAILLKDAAFRNAKTA